MAIQIDFVSYWIPTVFNFMESEKSSVWFQTN